MSVLIVGWVGVLSFEIKSPQVFQKSLAPLVIATEKSRPCYYVIVPDGSTIDYASAPGVNVQDNIHYYI